MGLTASIWFIRLDNFSNPFSSLVLSQSRRQTRTHCQSYTAARLSDGREVAKTSQAKIRRAWSGEGDGGVSRSPALARFSHQFSRHLHIIILEPRNRLDESNGRVQTNLHYFVIKKARNYCTNRRLFSLWFDFPFFLSRNIYQLPSIKNRTKTLDSLVIKQEWLIRQLKQNFC